MNLVLIGLAIAGANPRAGRAVNLGFAFLVFVVYFNLLVLGKNWIETGQVHVTVFLLALHGGVLVGALLWLSKRNNNWALPRLAYLRREALRHHENPAPPVVWRNAGIGGPSDPGLRHLVLFL